MFFPFHDVKCASHDVKRPSHDVKRTFHDVQRKKLRYVETFVRRSVTFFYIRNKIVEARNSLFFLLIPILFITFAFVIPWMMLALTKSMAWPIIIRKTCINVFF